MKNLKLLLILTLLIVASPGFAQIKPTEMEKARFSGVTTKTIDAHMNPLLRMMTPTAGQKAAAEKMGNRVMTCLYGKGSAATKGCPQFKQTEVTQEDRNRAKSLLSPIEKDNLVN